jgi:hypothetical protein
MIHRVFATVVMLGLCFGLVRDALAVGPCAQLCKGRHEPCSQICYLPGPFVTTCGQVGPCTNFPLAPSSIELLTDTDSDASAAVACQSEAVGVDLAGLAVACIGASIRIASSVASSVGLALG